MWSKDNSLRGTRLKRKGEGIEIRCVRTQRPEREEGGNAWKNTPGGRAGPGEEGRLLNLSSLRTQKYFRS